MDSPFVLAGTLVAAAQVSGSWATALLDLNLADKEGAHLVTGVQVGDQITLAISDIKPGATAAYRITAIGPRGGTSIRVTAAYMSGGAAPELDWVVNTTATLTRFVNGVPGIPSPGMQAMPDKLAFAGINEALLALSMPQAISALTYDGSGRVSSWTQAGSTYVATYGSDGLTAVTRDGQPYLTVTYTAGKLTSVSYP